MYNIHSGRLREQVVIKAKNTNPDDYGQVKDFDEVERLKADVEVKSGTQVNDYGTSITTEVITVLTRFRATVTNSMFLEWQGKTYEIKHVAPDRERRGMIITAMIEDKI